MRITSYRRCLSLYTLLVCRAARCILRSTHNELLVGGSDHGVLTIHVCPRCWPMDFLSVHLSYGLTTSIFFIYLFFFRTLSRLLAWGDDCGAETIEID